MLLDEHRSKLLFNEAGIETPQGELYTLDTIAGATPDFDLPWFVKAQVLTGGRGKAGGIKRVDKAEDFEAVAREVLSMQIKGEDVPVIRVEPGTVFVRELYLSFAVSRDRESLVLTVSRSGGVEVESGSSEDIFIQNVDIVTGPAAHQIRAAFFHMELEKELFKPFAQLIGKLFKAVTGFGLLLAEINPLVITDDGRLIPLDGKVEIDDNVRDMRTDLDRFFEPAHKTPEENIARDESLSFVKLKGWVGLMVNGAGLAMATMDLLNFSGLPAANFLDLGGGADRKRMGAALSLLFGDDSVKAVFINLYGGILSCEKVALAMRDVLGENAPDRPLVVRMSGNGATEGRAILKEMNLDGLHLVGDMKEAIELLGTLVERDPEPPVIQVPAAEPKPFPAQPEAPEKRFTFNLDAESGVLVQGITGQAAQLHTRMMRTYGTNVVAGVTPFKGGQEVEGVPVYNSVRDAVKDHDIKATIIFVPGAFAPDAILEAAENGIEWIVCITEGIAQKDMLAVLPKLRETGARLIGPNTPGIIKPGVMKMGIMPADPFTKGKVALFSRSGTLTYEAAARLSEVGIGQSVCVGIGGDPFIGLRFKDFMDMVREDPETEAVVVLGEIGGTAEENLAEYVARTGFDKPLSAFIAGRTAPPGKRLGHAGAIIEKNATPDGKLVALREAGIGVCTTMDELPGLVADTLK